MRSVRILALVTDAFGGHGGISRYNQDLLAALSFSEIVEEIVVLPRIGISAESDLPAGVHQYPPIFNRWRYCWRALRLAFSSPRFDTVFCGHILHAPIAALVARILHCPLWVQVHGVDCWKCPGRMVRWGLERANLITAVSRYTRRRLLGWARVPPENVRVLPNTVSDRFSPGPKSSVLLSKYSLNGNKILLTVSRISLREMYKGHDKVIQAMPRLLRLFPDLLYVVAGDGDGLDELKRLTSEAGVDEHVRFIGRVADEELPDLYRTADVFVMPSKGEGFGIVFLEALLSGLPVVGCNCDGSVDPLQDGAAGYGISCDSEDELVEAVQQALNKPRKILLGKSVFNKQNFSNYCTNLLKSIMENTKEDIKI